LQLGLQLGDVDLPQRSVVFDPKWAQPQGNASGPGFPRSRE